MTATIPNVQTASYAYQSEVDTQDIAAWMAGIAGTGVTSGCAVTAQGTPNMTVAVALGTVLVAGAIGSVTAGNQTIAAADSVNPRFDLIVVNSSGVVSVAQGTPAAHPSFPTIPANSVVLAAIYVPANATTITTSQIIDKRVVVSAAGYVNAANYGATGNGVTDDTTALQNAITAAAASTGALYIPAGTYLVSADLVVPSNCTIRGNGRATILKAKANTQPNIFKLLNVSHVTITDIAIDGNKANVNQIGIQYVSLSGIWLRGSDDITIMRCYIHDCYVSGIMADGGCTNLFISHNRLVNCFDNQIYIRAQDTAPYTPCSNGTITGNVCSGGSYSGIQILGSSYFSIVGNTCYNNGPSAGQGDGIGSEGASYLTITGNTCYGNGVQGINIRFTNEVGAAQVSSHIVVADNLIYNHTSTNGDAGGIGVSDTTDCTVMGNVVQGNAFGINVSGGNGNGVNHLQLIGNNVRNNTNIGIRISTTGADFVLQNNWVTDNAGDNLYTTNRVTIQGGVYARAAANKEGVHFATGSDSSLIQDAWIYDNLDNGVLIDSPVANIEMRNCFFDGGLTQNQTRAVQEQAGAGPTRMVNCRIQNQANNLYTFNNAASRYFDEKTHGIVTVTANYTLTANDVVVLVNKGSAATITLPAANGGVQGKSITIKDVSGAANTNNITVSGAQNIDGAANKVINTAYGVLRLVSDGNNWFTL